MGEETKPRERPTMGRIRELERDLADARSAGESYRHQRDLLAEEIKTLATATIPGTVEETSAEYVSIPVADLTALLGEMAEAGQASTAGFEKIRQNRKASYADRLQCKFLEGTSKSTAYWLQRLSKVVES